MGDLPTIDDVSGAAERLEGFGIRTPLLRSPLLDEITGARVFLKCENLQRTGSFKFRGAFNALSAQSGKIGGGVVACSSGNHAQGVAEAARIHGVPATIVMPRDAPATKKARTLRSGAKIVEYDRQTEDREAIASAIAQESGALFVHPYEDPYVIAGQGTAGLEAANDFRDAGIAPEMAFICAGGGGLMAGMTLALSKFFPDISIFSVEPEGFDDQKRSFEAGKRVANEPGKTSICDAIVSSMPGRSPFEICHGLVAGGVAVSDEDVLRTVAFAFNELKLVVEPGGAVALAALFANRKRIAGKTILATLSGGNIDQDMLMRALAVAPGSGALV